MRKGKTWSEFFSYLARIFLLLILLAVILPKLVTLCGSIVSSVDDREEKPSGNPMRVEEPHSEFVIEFFPAQ
ncbi:MAG: hypothetical protein GX958_03640 [Desulfitobacterium sp.]|nr:hypothetical protein [Desulfitobacterium sp.]